MTSASKPDRASFGRTSLGPLANTFIVAGGTLLSRILGLVREIVIAGQFGTNKTIEAYQATFTLIDMIYLLVAGGALGSAFIPVFAAFLEKKNLDDAWRLASGVLNVVLIALLVVCSSIALVAEPLVALTIGSGADQATRDLTVSILRIMLIQPILLGLGGLSKATLESFNRFALPVIGSNLYNIGIIGGALLAPWFGIDGLIWGVIIGAGLFLLVQVPGLRAISARYDRSAGIGTPGVGQVWRLLGPRLFGQAAWQLNFVAIASFASHLSQGNESAIRANSIAYQLMALPHGLIALSLGTVIFPQLARHYATGDHVAVRRLMLSALRSVLFLALPASVLLGVLGVPITRLLFQHGKFDAASTALTASALAPYALGLAAFAGAEIIVRTFYAMHDTRTPVAVGIGAMLLNIALGWTLMQLGWGLGGLALAFSLTNLTECAVLLWLLRTRLHGLGEGFWYALGRMLLATGACGGAVLLSLQLSQQWLPFLHPDGSYFLGSDLLPLALWLAAAAALGGLIYGGSAALLRLDEVYTLSERAARLFSRLRRSTTI